MPPTAPPEQAPGRLVWSYALDLTRFDPVDLIDEVWALHQPWCRGHQVAVFVGTLRPDDLDSRIPYGIHEALRKGVHVGIQGSPTAVAAWWRLLKPRKPARHLQVVS